jgi:Protein of unknown function (DUF3761)
MAPAASNVWPAPVYAGAARPPSRDRGRALLVTLSLLLGLALIGALTRGQADQTTTVGSTIVQGAASSAELPAARSGAATTIQTVTTSPETSKASSAVAVETTLTASTTTGATTTVAVTTVAPTAPPTFSPAQLAYFESVERAAIAATSTTQPRVANQVPAPGCGADSYVNSQGSCVPRPIAAPTAPAGATARCNDGTYSSSAHRSGTCSGHKGVAQWL